MKKFLLLFISLFIVSESFSQGKSIMQEQAERYSKFNYTSDKEWDALFKKENGTHENVAKLNTPNTIETCTLNKRVFGWHPYWVGSVYTNYQWNLLSDLCYFSYDTDPSTGNNTNSSFAWSSSAAVTTAINNGTNVHFCVTLFSSHTTFFNSSTAQQTLITNIINLLNSRGGKGVNIDFEGMGSSHKAPFTAFMQNLSTQLHAANPNYELSVCLYAVDWGPVFDIPNLDAYIDLYTIMGYDYYYGGSTTAGPEAPLYNFQTGYNYTLSRTVTDYLKKGATPSKVLLGLPYYGRYWTTTSSTAPSSTVSGGSTASVTYVSLRNNSNGYYSNANRHWEPNSFNPYWSYQVSGAWRQAWVDDARSMRYKLDMVNKRGIGGIGIWALGYDDGYSDFWDALRDYFSTCSTTSCTDTIYDMGGPTRTYYNNENYSYTIQPTGSSNVSMTFSQFDVEANFDTLWIYNGTSTTSPLIGAYTGTNSPGTVTSSNGALTLRFKSDGATVNPGFTAIYNCITSVDNVAPTTSVSAPSAWVTQDFTANFTDADDVGGSGVEKSFYQVLEYNGTEWRANNSRGFFSDNFDSVIHPDWTIYSGNWAINGGYLEQSDESNTNTNIWAPCKQTLSNRYLYNWQGKINGSGTNRRAGFHFFCDSANTANRMNSYFVWFRVDQSAIEIYKVINDAFTLESSTPYTFPVNTFYDYTVTFDRISGEIQLWIDNALAASWTDPSPHTAGNYISFRSGNCVYTVNNLKVYRSRYPSVTVTVGPASTNDLRYENTDPSSPAGRVKSIIKDTANNLSLVAALDINVDWTAPIPGSLVNDGNPTDLDTTYNTTQLTGSYTMATDTNSGVARYFYAIGTTPGTRNVVDWTDNSTGLSVTEAGLSLVVGQHYYFMVKSQNGAGIMSDSTVSDGILVLSPTGIKELTSIENAIVFPNPANEYIVLSIIAERSTQINYELRDAGGKLIITRQHAAFSEGLNNLKIDLSEHSLSKGVYILSIFNEGKSISRKIIIE